jgi:hypothetical protein
MEQTGVVYKVGEKIEKGFTDRLLYHTIFSENSGFCVSLRLATNLPQSHKRGKEKLNIKKGTVLVNR